MKYDNFETLKTNRDFRNVYNRKKSFANKYLIMYIRENGTDTLKLGVSVSKKVGNSIVRHRLARLIREAFRLHTQDIRGGLDVVVIARENLKGKNYFETESAMIHLFKLHHIYAAGNMEKKYDKESNDSSGKVLSKGDFTV